MIEELFVAICLMLVLEGILPFVAPARWRQALLSVIAMPDNQIRIIGFSSMLLGAGLLYLFN